MKHERASHGFVQRDWVPEKSVQSFLTLFKFIEAKTGSQGSAAKYCGMSDAAISMIRSGKRQMTVLVAKRISDGYKRLKAESCNTSPAISTISAKSA